MIVIMIVIKLTGMMGGALISFISPRPWIKLVILRVDRELTGFKIEQVKIT